MLVYLLLDFCLECSQCLEHPANLPSHPLVSHPLLLPFLHPCVSQLTVSPQNIITCPFQEICIRGVVMMVASVKGGAGTQMSLHCISRGDMGVNEVSVWLGVCITRDVMTINVIKVPPIYRIIQHWINCLVFNQTVIIWSHRNCHVWEM